jgi:hypothetical protein
MSVLLDAPCIEEDRNYAEQSGLTHRLQRRLRAKLRITGHSA